MAFEFQYIDPPMRRSLFCTFNSGCVTARARGILTRCKIIDIHIRKIRSIGKHVIDKSIMHTFVFVVTVRSGEYIALNKYYNLVLQLSKFCLPPYNIRMRPFLSSIRYGNSHRRINVESMSKQSPRVRTLPLHAGHLRRRVLLARFTRAPCISLGPHFSLVFFPFSTSSAPRTSLARISRDISPSRV